MISSADLIKRYEFDWEILDVIIGGQSAIDGGKRLGIRSIEDAERFIECYGYNLDNPIERAELFGNFQEALTFIRRYFLKPDNADGLNLEVPRKIAELTDISQLLIFASAPSGFASSGQTLTALWACAIIKIMHTIAHIDKDLRSNYFVDIQKQILDRFYKFIHSDETGQVYLGKDIRDIDRVDLVTFETKPKKARDSVILKLLHKPENVAEDIFDRVGIRFVTKNRLDAIRIVRYLKDRYVIMPANIKPSRSRNTLLDTQLFTSQVNEVLRKLQEGRISPSDVTATLSDLCEHDAAGSETGVDNPHTSSHYRAIQFTCRQLVKIQNPLYDDVRAIKNSIKGATVSEELAKIAERLDLRNIQKEIRFFYPFEVQILDEKSHKENLAGRSSHSNYKKSQIQTAMKRVMGELIRFGEKSPVEDGQ